MKRTGAGRPPAEKAETPSKESPPASAGTGHAGRNRLVVVLVCAGLIAAAYGGGRLQDVVSLRAAKAQWDAEKAKLTDSLAARDRELAGLRAQSVLWKLDAGLSQVMADIADKNYGLARDAAADAAGILARMPADMDSSTRDRLQPLAALLEDTRQAADAVSPEALVKARAARALVQQILSGSAGPLPAGPGVNPSAGAGGGSPPADGGGGSGS